MKGWGGRGKREDKTRTCNMHRRQRGSGKREQ